VDARLTHIKEELANYRWRKDSRGQAMPIPEPGQDHLIDALRYAMEGDSQGRQAKLY
jgi:phage terminase large subunit